MAPEPRANPLLLGHEAAETTLLEAMRSGRMHHAWLITGPDGVGKATLAYRFARRLLAGVPTAAEPDSGARADPPGVPPRRRRRACRPATRSSGPTTKSAAACARRSRSRTSARSARLHEPDPGRGRLARRHRRWRRGPEPVLRQRPAEDPGGAAAAGDPAAGVRRSRPAARHHPQPLPPAAAGPAAADERWSALLSLYLPEHGADEREPAGRRWRRARPAAPCCWRRRKA